MAIRIITIPHNEQRYNTIGDWQRQGDDALITVSDMNSALYEFLVGIHELIEMYLCEQSGISDEEVTTFDEMILETMPDYEGEPGSIIGAPYYRQHLIATIIERLLADELGIDWNDYDEAVGNVGMFSELNKENKNG